MSICTYNPLPLFHFASMRAAEPDRPLKDQFHSTMYCGLFFLIHSLNISIKTKTSVKYVRLIKSCFNEEGGTEQKTCRISEMKKNKISKMKILQDKQFQLQSDTTSHFKENNFKMQVE